MKLYLVSSELGPLYVRTQDEAKKIARERQGSWQSVNADTSQRGLVDYLNKLVGALIMNREFAELLAGHEARASERPTTPGVSPATAAAAPTPTLTNVEEFIQAAQHAALASITENVIYRMRELLQATR